MKKLPQLQKREHSISKTTLFHILSHIFKYEAHIWKDGKSFRIGQFFAQFVSVCIFLSNSKTGTVVVPTFHVPPSFFSESCHQKLLADYRLEKIKKT